MDTILNWKNSKIQFLKVSVHLKHNSLLMLLKCKLDALCGILFLIVGSQSSETDSNLKLEYIILNYFLNTVFQQKPLRNM